MIILIPDEISNKSQKWANKTAERNVARINEFLIDSVNKPVEPSGAMKAVVEKGERKHEARFASAETSGLCNTNRRRVNRGDNRRETKQKREHNSGSCFNSACCFVRFHRFHLSGERTNYVHRFFAVFQCHARNARRIN